jgi:transposase InsO family protein
LGEHDKRRAEKGDWDGEAHANLPLPPGSIGPFAGFPRGLGAGFGSARRGSQSGAAASVAEAPPHVNVIEADVMEARRQVLRILNPNAHVQRAAERRRRECTRQRGADREREGSDETFALASPLGTGPPLPSRAHLESRFPLWFLYRVIVLDALSRRVVGWAMANHLRIELVLDALDRATIGPGWLSNEISPRSCFEQEASRRPELADGTNTVIRRTRIERLLLAQRRSYSQFA